MEMAHDLHDTDYERYANEANERESARRRLIEARPRGEERWYLAREGSRFNEARANDLFEEYDCETYAPKVRKLVPIPLRELSLKQRRLAIKPRREKLDTLFPGYRLMKLDFRRGDWRELFERVGMFGIIGAEENDRLLPRYVPDRVIEEFRHREAAGAIPGSLSIRDLGFAVGEAVRISDGHMSGFNGCVYRLPNIPIEDVDEDVRVRLAVLMFGRVTLVEIPLAHIEKL